MEKTRSKYSSGNGKVSGVDSTKDTLVALTVCCATRRASELASTATSSPTNGATSTSHRPLPQPKSKAFRGFLLQSTSEKYLWKTCARSDSLRHSWVNVLHSWPKPLTVSGSRFVVLATLLDFALDR